MSLLDLNWMLHLHFHTESDVPRAIVEQSLIIWGRASSSPFKLIRRFGGISRLKGDLEACSGIVSGLAHSYPEGRGDIFLRTVELH
jgi:hypothetical protein